MVSVESDRAPAEAGQAAASTTAPAREASLEPAVEDGSEGGPSDTATDNRAATPARQVEAEARTADDSIPGRTNRSSTDRGFLATESGGQATELGSDFGDPPDQLALAVAADGPRSGRGSTSPLELAVAGIAVMATLGAVLVRKRQATFG